MNDADAYEKFVGLTFDEDECYGLFLAVDDRVRQLSQPPADLLKLHDKLLPFYSMRHPG